MIYFLLKQKGKGHLHKRVSKSRISNARLWPDGELLVGHPLNHVQVTNIIIIYFGHWGFTLRGRSSPLFSSRWDCKKSWHSFAPILIMFVKIDSQAISPVVSPMLFIAGFLTSGRLMSFLKKMDRTAGGLTEALCYCKENRRPKVWALWVVWHLLSTDLNSV